MEILLKVLRLFAANKNVVWRQQQSADRITGRVIQILTTARLSLLLYIHLANNLWNLNHKSGALQSAKWVWSHFPNTAHIPSFYVWQKADVCRSCECRICPEFTGDGDSGSMLRRRRGAGGQHSADTTLGGDMRAAEWILWLGTFRHITAAPIFM